MRLGKKNEENKIPITKEDPAKTKFLTPNIDEELGTNEAYFRTVLIIRINDLIMHLDRLAALKELELGLRQDDEYLSFYPIKAAPPRRT